MQKQPSPGSTQYAGVAGVDILLARDVGIMQSILTPSRPQGVPATFPHQSSRCLHRAYRGFLFSSPLFASELSREGAESLLRDTFTIAAHTGLNGGSDYAGRPENIIGAALFGAFNARME